MTSPMKSNIISRTLNYQRVQKPLLERQRRARINKCLDALKQIMAECQQNDAIRHMDKAEMLESTINYMRTKSRTAAEPAPAVYVDSYKHGYMNAVNEVSRVLASTPGMSVELGKSVMMHLGRVYNRLQHQHQQQQQQQQKTEERQQQQTMQPLIIDCMSAPLSPASSGYQSDMESPQVSPVCDPIKLQSTIWRPW